MSLGWGSMDDRYGHCSRTTRIVRRQKPGMVGLADLRKVNATIIAAWLTAAALDVAIGYGGYRAVVWIVDAVVARIVTP